MDQVVLPLRCQQAPAQGTPIHTNHKRMDVSNCSNGLDVAGLGFHVMWLSIFESGNCKSPICSRCLAASIRPVWRIKSCSLGEQADDIAQNQNMTCKEAEKEE